MCKSIQIVKLTDDLKLDRKIKHDIEIVIDRLKNDPKVRTRLAEAVEQALGLSEGSLIVAVESPGASAPGSASRSRDVSAGASARGSEDSTPGSIPKAKTQSAERDRCPNPSLGLKPRVESSEPGGGTRGRNPGVEPGAELADGCHFFRSRR